MTFQLLQEDTILKSNFAEENEHNVHLSPKINISEVQKKINISHLELMKRGRERERRKE